MPRTASRKVTVSMPPDLIRFADAKALELGIARSQFIGDLIREMRSRERDELAREGYAFFAKDAEEFADLSMRIAHEVLEDDSPAR